MPEIVSKYQPLQHYQWGDACDGWNLVDEPGLSVKQERMPAGTAEALHYHEKAQQFFYILQGTARFTIEAETVELHAGQGIRIEPGQGHKISNAAAEPLEFILCSQPSTRNDRINCT
jgi:mannose-6-phosphate isomerase-like protein (cupin superfamily)